jgi:penicillin V acylase-like amidase (Ntn superfamily)
MGEPPDPSGDSAILEYLGGKLVTHHGPEYKVMTNSPPYDQQGCGAFGPLT